MRTSKVVKEVHLFETEFGKEVGKFSRLFYNAIAFSVEQAQK